MAETSQAPTADTQLFRDVFNASPIGIAVENLEGKLLFVNSTLCSILGFSEEELRRKHRAELSPPDDAANDETLSKKLRAGSIDRYQVEKRYFRRDGSRLWVRLSISLLNSGSSPLVLVMVEDITDKKNLELENKRAEESLRESEERLRLAAHAGRMFAYSWDAATGLIERSGEYADILGVSKEAAAAGAISVTVHPDDQQRLEAALARLTVENPTLRIAYRIIRPDGAIMWLERTSRAYFDAQAKLERIVGMILDVTERKRAEDKLREYERAVEGLEEMIVVVDREYRYLLANGEFLSRRNMTREQVVGHFAHEVMNKGVFEAVVRQKLDECFQGKTVRFEMKYTYPELGERDIAVSYFPIEGNTGVDRVACIFQDITERKWAEEALHESEERFRLVANTAPVMIWMSGPDKKPSYFNQLWLDFTGLSATDLQNGLAGIVHPEDYKECHEIYCRGFDQRQPFRKECRLRRHDGQYRWMLDIGVPRFHKDGSFAGYIGSCIDVTDHKLVEEALSGMTRKLVEAQEQERARIARELHDDINQRLALLAIELEQLQDSPSEMSCRVQELRNQTIEISNGLQALSHDLHSSQLEYLGVVAGMKGWCEEFGERQRMQIHCKQDLRSTLPPEVGICLFRVLQESLHNAAKHSGVKRIEVELKEDSNDIHLIVSDSGRGFDVEAVKQGKGLGLTSMRERVRLVNGTIAIESRPMGGTTIHVRVPLAKLQMTQIAV